MAYCIACGVTNQVISAGDLCQVVPIRQQRSHHPVVMRVGAEQRVRSGFANTIVGPNAFWAPMGAFVAGVYNDDSGQVDPVDTPHNRRALLEFILDLEATAPWIQAGTQRPERNIEFNMSQVLKNQAPQLAPFVASRHVASTDLATVPFAEFAAVWQVIWDVAAEQRLFATDPEGHALPVSFTAIHQAAFSQMVKFTVQQIMGEAGSAPSAAYLAHLVAWAKAQVGRVAPVAAHCGDVNPQVLTSLVATKVTEGMRLGLTASATHNLLFPFMLSHQALITRHLNQELNADELLAVLQPAWEAVYVLKGMTDLHLKFAPYAYAGQDYANEKGRTYAKLVAATAEAIQAANQAKCDE